MKKPLCIDLFSGLGGWAEGFLAEGYDVVGFDVTRHVYGDEKYPAQLVLQDVLTIDGAQFRDAAVIVASPPCQQYSWLAMPWSRSKTDGSQAAKALRRKWETEGPDNRLFDACFRIQREASAAAGRHIPMVVENVRGAQPWVGPARGKYGSFYLWGDVPAILPIARKVHKNVTGGTWFGVDGCYRPGGRNDGRKAIEHAESAAVKIGGDWFSDPNSPCRRHGSKSNARKRASAMIAKIPFELARHVASVFLPDAQKRPHG